MDGPAGFVEGDGAAEAKRRRDVTYNVRQVPALRLLGLVLLSILLLVHRAGTPGGWPALSSWSIFVAGALAYAGISWLILVRVYSRRPAEAPPSEAGFVFLALDVLWFTGAIWISGGSDSWLFFLLLVRVADQTNTTLRRVLLLLHLSVASYLLMLAGEHLVLDRPPHWGLEATKLAGVYVMGLYLASTTRTADGLRRRTREAIHYARQLVRQLREQSASLEKARAGAEQAARAKSEFLANMGHELRTPLNGIIGLTDLVLDSELTAEQREYLTGVRTSGQNLLRVVNAVLELARVQPEELTATTIDVPGLVRDLARQLRPEADRRHLDMVVDIPPDFPVPLSGAAGSLRRILFNLGDNALKFTSQGSVTLTARVAGREQDRIDVELGVIDTGIGIAGDQQAAIFEPFTQVDGSAGRRQEGCGLGLALVKKLVEGARGRVRVESQPGHGAAFYVTMPMTVTQPSGSRA